MEYGKLVHGFSVPPSRLASTSVRESRRAIFHLPPSTYLTPPCSDWDAYQPEQEGVLDLSDVKPEIANHFLALESFWGTVP